MNFLYNILSAIGLINVLNNHITFANKALLENGTHNEPNQYVYPYNNKYVFKNNTIDLKSERYYENPKVQGNIMNKKPKKKLSKIKRDIKIIGIFITRS